MRRTSRKARNCRTQSPNFWRTWWPGRPGTSRQKPLCRKPWPWHLRRTFRPSRPREAGPNLHYKWRCKWWARLSAARIFAPPRHPRVALLLDKNTSPEQSAIQIHDMIKSKIYQNLCDIKFDAKKHNWYYRKI